jgi:hypothetical protein
VPDTIDQSIVDAILDHQVDLMRVEAGTRARVIRLLNRMQVDLVSQLRGGNVTELNKARLQSLLRQTNETIDSYYTRVEGELDITLREIARIQADHTATLVSTTSASIPTETFLTRLVSNVLIHGAPSSDWWARQSQNMTFKFGNAVRQGVAQGETNEQIVARITGKPRLGIPGVIDMPRRDARSLVHTSIQTVANASRMETFRQNSDVVTGVRQLSTFDSHTTETCIAYADQEWDLEGNPINGTKLPFVNPGGSLSGTPRHWGCRSVMVPRTKTFKELGINIPEPKPLRTMDQWMASRTPEQLDELLGKGRAEMYRNGSITREQLLNLSGHPMTLLQLRAKYTKP